MIKSILQTNDLPPEDSKVVHVFEDLDYGPCEVSSFIGDGSPSDVIRAVDTLRILSKGFDYVYIEGFTKRADGAYQVILGS